jgi:hypothetical protein
LFENQVQKREKIQSSQRHFSRFVLLPPVYAQCVPYCTYKPWLLAKHKIGQNTN